MAGLKRRVPGLRREEVAALAGLSIDYYIRLERGALTNASDSVLHVIARALQLDATEQAHLIDLARASQAVPVRRSHRTPPATIARNCRRCSTPLSGSPRWCAFPPST
ncbi:helix-turn-helix domain-containing protein [Streptomyces sp. NPDC000941]